MGGGSAGFSTNSVMLALVVDGHHAEGAGLARGTSMQPTVHVRALATWSASISA
jgi:hypothetical protein